MLAKALKSLKHLLAAGNRLDDINNGVHGLLAGQNVHGASTACSLGLDYAAQLFVDGHADYYRKVREAMSIAHPRGVDLVRIGGDNDGGYVMADCFHEDAVAYSLGVGNDITWDAALAARGIHVFMYDHTVDPDTGGNAFLHFRRKGVGRANRGDIVTLESQMSANGHGQRRDLILKMDIEGFEYEVIDATPPQVLARFSQIVVEFHDILHPGNIMFLRCLEKLNAVFQPIHVHGQNVHPHVRIGEDTVLTDYVEMTFLRREDHEFVAPESSLPLPADMPTYAHLPEVRLGDFARR